MAIKPSEEHDQDSPPRPASADDTTQIDTLEAPLPTASIPYR